MSKAPSDQTQNSEDELLPEYQFDYEKAKPNRFALARSPLSLAHRK
ncbi:MAG: hypothetical protein NW224_26495 [Leptolyngbyaceae cyanobacterium bins.302]|nr:hypothetical protein [Leptolyngbyaceae cyanobacterium bins.302]